jgi:hypothetical protein
VKTVRTWLLILAAITLASPLGAEEINAPEAQPQIASTGQPSNANGAAQTADQAAEQTVVSPAVPPVVPADSPAPAAVVAPVKPANSQDSHERAMGMLPMYTVVNDASTARALSVSEKFRLFYRQTYDPFQFASVAITAGISQAENDLSGYGQGMEGYGKRYGATLADNSLGAFFGNFLLPSLMHEDPRYFRMGSGGFVRRLLHAAGSQLIAHRDNGTIGPAYANVMGNFIGCGIGNLYYPSTDRGVGTTFERGAEVTLNAMVGATLQEFWPDIHNKIFGKNKTAK